MIEHMAKGQIDKPAGDKLGFDFWFHLPSSHL